MLYWLVCFGAITSTIFGKWYFTDALSRLRRTHAKQQREALETKGTLQEVRLAHQDILRQIKMKEIEITKMKKRLAEQKVELQARENRPKTGLNKLTKKRDR